MKKKKQEGEERNEIAFNCQKLSKNPFFFFPLFPLSLSLSELIGILLDMSLPYKVIVLGVFSRSKSQQSL